MRAIALAIGLLFASPTHAQELKAFDFMGFTAGDPVPPEKLKKCGKGAHVTCVEALAKVSNVYVGYSVTVHDGRLSTVYIDAHPNSYSDLLRAFTAKYGEPCETKDAVWKNAAGAELTNPTTYWCFKSGKLMFAKYGARIDRMAIFYEDANKAPERAPIINF